MSDQEHIQALIRGLANFRTRSQAMRDLLLEGESAVAPLIEALDHRLEPVVWSAAHTLGRLGDARAVAPLIEAMARGRAVGAVSGALASLTDRDLGEDVAAWRRFAAGQEDERADGTVAPLDPLALVDAAVEGSEIARERLSDLDFSLTVPLPTGRRQTVRVLFNSKDAEGAELIVVYSECGPARERTYEWALRKNLTIPYGAFAIRDVQGSPEFVMVNTMLRASTDPRALRKSIDTMASRSDALERALTQADER